MEESCGNCDWSRLVDDRIRGEKRSWPGVSAELEEEGREKAALGMETRRKSDEVRLDRAGVRVDSIPPIWRQVRGETFAKGERDEGSMKGERVELRLWAAKEGVALPTDN